MSEKAAPPMLKKAREKLPKPPQEASAKSLYIKENADDVTKGLHGTTEKDRLAMGMKWLKAHGEVDYKGDDVKKIIPPPLKKESKGKGHGERGGHSSPHTEVHSPFTEQKGKHGEEEGHSKDDEEGQQERDRVQEAKGLNKQRSTKEVWADLLMPVGKKIATASSGKETVTLDRDDRGLLEVFIASAQNKMLEENFELKWLVGQLAQLPPEYPKPPNDPSIAPELRDAWVRFDLLRQTASFFQAQAAYPETSLPPEDAKNLGRFLSEIFRLFPSDPATAPVKPEAAPQQHAA